MRWLSGDHCGRQVSGPPNEGSWPQFEPSLAQAQISNLPERTDSNANFRPSGEYWANSSCVEEMNLVGALALPDFRQSGIWTRQISRSPHEPAAYARRGPCLEIVGELPLIRPSRCGLPGLPPNLGRAIFHKRPPERAEEKTMSRPLEVHAVSSRIVLSQVIRLGSPSGTKAALKA